MYRIKQPIKIHVPGKFSASMAGLRFGDQILQIDGQTVAGWDTDRTMDVLKKTSPERISFAVRDR